MIHLTDATAVSPWRFPFCPEPPDWGLDWAGLMDGFADIRALADIPQDPVHHAEGDVLTHTKQVVEALCADENWRILDPSARSAVFAAALFHDAGKAGTTVTGPDGKISSHGHSRQSQRIVRRVLWQDWTAGRSARDDVAVPFWWRETVVNLVRFHGSPPNIWRAESPEKLVTQISLLVRPDWLALLARADVRGRTTADQAELLDAIAWFVEECRRFGCYDTARPFRSAHTRVMFFHGRPAEVEAFDDTVGEVILMAGLPAVGKDRWLRDRAPSWPRIALDRIREELGIAPDERQGPVIDAAKARAKVHLRARENFIWNATNVSSMMRAQLLGLFADYRFRVRIVYLDAPWAEILQRNRSRGRSVPEAVLLRLANKLDVPTLAECHAVEWIAG